MLQLARVSKEDKMVVKSVNPKQKFKSCQIIKQKFYNVSDFKWTLLQRVRFWIKNFTTRQFLN